MAQPVNVPLVDAAANLRRSAIVACILGVAAIAVTAAMGHPLIGIFAFLGMVLAALNNRLLQGSLARYSADPSIKRAQISRKVFLRLIGLTAIAFGFALLVRPDGLAVFVGLAVFQVLMLVGAAVPVFRGMQRPGLR
jgi:hypothetical protein